MKKNIYFILGPALCYIVVFFIANKVLSAEDCTPEIFQHCHWQTGTFGCSSPPNPCRHDSTRPDCRVCWVTDESTGIASSRVYCCPSPFPTPTPTPCTECKNGLNVGDAQCVGNDIYKCDRVNNECKGILSEKCAQGKVCENTSDSTAECKSTPTPTPTPGPTCERDGIIYNAGATICHAPEGQAIRIIKCDPNNPQNSLLGGWDHSLGQTCYIGCETTGSPPNTTARCTSRCRGSFDCKNGAPCQENQACKITSTNPFDCACIECTQNNCGGVACGANEECKIIDIPDHPGNGCTCHPRSSDDQQSNQDASPDP